MAATQFNLLTSLGLRENHLLLDIGCGSLRAGRLFIPYLLRGRYFGLEPERWLVQDGIRNEIGKDLVRIKAPTFLYRSDWKLSEFGAAFDFILAQSVFSHASRSQIRICLDEVATSLNPEGAFVFSFLVGTADSDAASWTYPGCVAYTVEGMERLLEAAGLSFRVLTVPHPNGLTWALGGRGDLGRFISLSIWPMP